MYPEVYQTFYERILSVMFKDFAIYILINVLINVQIPPKKNELALEDKHITTN